MTTKVETLKTEWYKVAYSNDHRLATLQEVTEGDRVYYTVNGDIHHPYNSLALANEWFTLITT